MAKIREKNCNFCKKNQLYYLLFVLRQEIGSEGNFFPIFKPILESFKSNKKSCLCGDRINQFIVYFLHLSGERMHDKSWINQLEISELQVTYQSIFFSFTQKELWNHGHSQVQESDSKLQRPQVFAHYNSAAFICLWIT